MTHFSLKPQNSITSQNDFASKGVFLSPVTCSPPKNQMIFWMIRAGQVWFLLRTTMKISE